MLVLTSCSFFGRGRAVVEVREFDTIISNPEKSIFRYLALPYVAESS